MRTLTLENIAKAVQGELKYNGTLTEAEATGVYIDSRQCGEGSLFAAFKGERVDGHNFLPQVFKQGALGAIVETLPEGELPGPCILVKKTETALQQLAKFYREQLNIKIVGIVGSVGKTSTKELVAAVLSKKYKVLKTAGNLNNEIGVPLTVLSIRDEHEMAVVEMGISAFGEMDILGEIVKPDAVAMTNIGPCHLEQLGDLDGVLKEKSEVIKFIGKAEISNCGVGKACKDNAKKLLVLNGEDEKLALIKETCGCETVKYGCGCDVVAENPASMGLMGTDFDVVYKGEKLGRAHVPLPGKHQVMNALAAAAVGMHFGLTPDEVVEGIGAVETVSGRSNLIKTEKYLLIDDCYNANPKSMRAAVDMMRDAEGRKCAILGDMFELGADEAKLHAEVGSYAVENGIELLVCVGGLSKNMYEAALEACKSAEPGTGASKAGGCDSCERTPEVIHAESLEKLLAMVENEETTPFKKGDNILIKASHGMNFAEVVDRMKNL